jgi:DNA-binding MarR family transcriptional regulator
VAWGGEPAFRATLVGGRDRAMAEAITRAGGEIVAEIAWGEPVPAALETFLVLDTGGEDRPGLPEAVEALAERADVVCCDLAQLDLVAGALLLTDVQFLCEPDMVERVAALLVATRLDDPTAPGAVRETDSEKLSRLNDELARLVDLLARLAPSEPRPGGLADRTSGFGAPPPESGENPVDPAEVRRVIRARRLRDKAFGPGLFEDPAWDILLDLFAASLERSEVSVSSLCIAAAVAPTTALRWVGRMTAAGLLVRQHDPFDRRRALMSLSDRATAAMRSYVAMLRAQGLPFV